MLKPHQESSLDPLESLGQNAEVATLQPTPTPTQRRKAGLKGSPINIRVEIADIESFSAFVERNEYRFLPNVMPQTVAAAILKEKWDAGYRQITIKLATTLIRDAYKRNPSEFARRIKNISYCPDKCLVGCKVQDDVFTIVGAATKPEVSTTYLGGIVRRLLTNPELTIKFSTEGAPDTWSRYPRLLKYRVQRNIRDELNVPTVEVLFREFEKTIRLTIAPPHDDIRVAIAQSKYASHANLKDNSGNSGPE